MFRYLATLGHRQKLQNAFTLRSALNNIWVSVPDRLKFFWPLSMCKSYRACDQLKRRTIPVYVQTILLI